MHKRVDLGTTVGGTLFALLGLFINDFGIAFLGALLIVAGYPLTELFAHLGSEQRTNRSRN